MIAQPADEAAVGARVHGAAQHPDRAVALGRPRPVAMRGRDPPGRVVGEAGVHYDFHAPLAEPMRHRPDAGLGRPDLGRVVMREEDDVHGGKARRPGAAALVALILCVRGF